MKYCTEVSMQTYLWHPKDTRKRAEVSLHAACVHVWVPQRGLSSWDSSELHSPGSQVAREPLSSFPVHRFQVCAVLCIFTWRLTAFILFSPPPCFSLAQLNKQQLQVLKERFQAFLNGETQIVADEAFCNAVRSYYEVSCVLCALCYVHSMPSNAGTRKVILSFKGYELPNFLETISS